MLYNYNNSLCEVMAHDVYGYVSIHTSMHVHSYMYVYQNQIVKNMMFVCSIVIDQQFLFCFLHKQCNCFLQKTPRGIDSNHCMHTFIPFLCSFICFFIHYFHLCSLYTFSCINMLLTLLTYCRYNNF